MGEARIHYFTFLGSVNFFCSLGCLGDEGHMGAKAKYIRFGRPNHLITKTAVGLEWTYSLSS